MAVARLPLPPANGALISGAMLDATTKGIPASVGEVRLSDIGAKGWNLLAGDVPLPAAVIRLDKLHANSVWMSAFTRLNELDIAPHGKTTMAPQLYALQLQAGAFAITVATAQQLAVCRRFGIPRVIIANQPIGRVSVDACFAALSANDGFELYVLADSLDVVRAYADAAARNRGARPLEVLVEMGVAGGRTGARSREAGLVVARAVAAAPGLRLAGIECFEGILPDTTAVDLLLDDVVSVAKAAAGEGLFATDRAIVLSAGGSSFFDRVGERFTTAEFGGRRIIKLLRSGCYLTHDSGGYATAFGRIVAESRLKLPAGGLEAALEVWAYVQSRNDRGKSILTMGKRDVSHDSTLPTPLKWYRPGLHDTPQPMPRGHAVTALNDQHCHMGTPGESPLKVGDMVGFGIGHPCTTFDKWNLLLCVDESYRIVDAVKTFF